MATAIDQDDPDVINMAQNADIRPKHVLETSLTEVYAADEEAMVRLLRTKMKHALAESGFDQEAQAQVSHLVEGNVISCGIIANACQLMQQDLFEYGSIRNQLEDLMTTGFQINSNEPVLLILADSAENVSWDAISAMKNATRTILRDNFNVMPVRIYVAQHRDDGNRTINSRNGFSLALLNVVNTDIGGPSMIQLLDEATAALDWERMVVSAEAWHGSEMLWLKEKHSQLEQADETCTAEDEPTIQRNEIVEDAPQGPGSTTVDPEQSHPAKASIGQDGEILLDEPDHKADGNESPIPREHPAMTELLAREAERVPVQHPSWNHQGNVDSLIDLIRMQAATVADSNSLVDMDDGDHDADM